MPPHPSQPSTRKVSAGIDAAVEQAPDGPIGLGFRVPLVIASPWSRGGYVCSQVFDHTSILQFLENFLSAKTGHAIREPNISEWRRTVCGDLTSVFRPYHGEKINPPTPVQRAPFLGSIDQAQFKPVPSDFKHLTADEIVQARKNPDASRVLPRQENGVRAACALPYELTADGILSEDKKTFTIRLAAGKNLFGEKAAGAPFFIYAPSKVRVASGTPDQLEAGRTWNYAVSAGDTLTDTWALDDFADGIYHLRVHGPNGFFREFRGSAQDPQFELTLQPTPQANHVLLNFINRNSQEPLTVLVDDLAYGDKQHTINLSPAGKKTASASLTLDLTRSFGWHDLRIRVAGTPDFEQRYAGRIETGRESFSDPAMGRV
jgi:phospholipase C